MQHILWVAKKANEEVYIEVAEQQNLVIIIRKVKFKPIWTLLQKMEVTETDNHWKNSREKEKEEHRIKVSVPG